MILLFVLGFFFMMIIIDVLFIHSKEEDVKERTNEQEIYYTPEVGFTMCDGGEPIKKESKKVDS